MIVSKNWLQEYFEDKLPDADKLADLFNFHSFEIESIEKKGDDEIFDVKVLPDRACYALSFRGIASEVKAAGNFKLAKVSLQSPEQAINKKPEIQIETKTLCSRYMGRFVGNVEVGPSPESFKRKLESIGERSINNIVDAANLVMFDTGQPLHAFDADKVVGAIVVRLSKEGERITTLDGQEIELSPKTLVIADEESVLAIAGIKGGKKAEVTGSTKNLILESANFDRSSVRLSSTKYNLKTQAAKRFEAGLSPEVAADGMNGLSARIAEVSPEAKFGPVNDLYIHKQKQQKIEVASQFIADVLGVEIGEDEIVSILARLDIIAEKKGKTLEIIPPAVRTDLSIPEDIVEEVGRIYGYDKIASKLPPAIKGRAPIDKNFYYLEKIKNLLTGQGFSEVSLYTLTDKGLIEAAKPLAEDKKFLRDSLAPGIKQALERNARNAPVLGLSEIRIFEIGHVFVSHGERIYLAIGRRSLLKKGRKNEEILSEIMNLLSSALELPISGKVSTGPEGAVAEFDLTEIFIHSPSRFSYDELEFGKLSEQRFRPFSLFPFALRDIAVFTPKGTDKNEPLEIIRKFAGSLLERVDLFDVFEKDIDGKPKTSFAFHLVFQSPDRTLTDLEVNTIMDNITREMNAKKGWQVR